MSDLLDSNIRIVKYSVPRIPDPWAIGHRLSWQDYNHARNKVVQVCRRHGGVSPSGRCTIDSGSQPETWEPEDVDPLYFIVEDQLNYERYIYIDMLSRDALSRRWLEDIVVALGTMPYWGVGVTNISDGYALIFSNMLLVAGPQFERLELEHILDRWRATLVV